MPTCAVVKGLAMPVVVPAVKMLADSQCLTALRKVVKAGQGTSVRVQQ